jgi:thioredoxin 1
MSDVIFTDKNFDEEVTKAKGLVMVDFFAPWCGPCKMMAPFVDRLAETYKGKVKIGKLDVDGNPDTGNKFGIQSIPTILFFKDGKLVEQLVGFQSEEVLKKKLDTL